MTRRADSRRKSARVFGATTAVIGSVLVLRPKAAAALVSGSTPHPVVVRALGGRQLVQGVAVLIRPERSLLRMGSVTDLLHAATMVAASWWWPRYSRPALASAAMAATSAAAGGLLSRTYR